MLFFYRWNTFIDVSSVVEIGNGDRLSVVAKPKVSLKAYVQLKPLPFNSHPQVVAFPNYVASLFTVEPLNIPSLQR